MLALAGIGGGMMLGEMVVGGRARGISAETSSFSRLSANPDALVPQGKGAPPCSDCVDSYGVAMRMRAHRDDRMSDEFRALGAVDIDPPTRTDPVDDYRYGGRFPDPEPRTGRPSIQMESVPAATLSGGAPPSDEAPSPPIVY
jgi:hypothetical protein